MMKEAKLISPYGGKLIDLLAKGDEREELLKLASTYPSVQLTPRQTHDMELLAVGGFSPLERFMGQDDYQSVLDEMTLADGTIWPIPITLTIDKEDLPDQADWVTLRDVHNQIMAVMRVEEIFRFSWKEEAERKESVFREALVTPRSTSTKRAGFLPSWIACSLI